jgi:serine/threonine protein kinase
MVYQTWKLPIWTYRYLAPEGFIPECRVTSALDIWSAACTFVEMITGKPPFWEILDECQIMYKLCNQKQNPLIQVPKGFPKELTDILSMCFSHNQKTRLSANAAALRLSVLLSSMQCPREAPHEISLYQISNPISIIAVMAVSFVFGRVGYQSAIVQTPLLLFTAVSGVACCLPSSLRQVCLEQVQTWRLNICAASQVFLARIQIFTETQNHVKEGRNNLAKSNLTTTVGQKNLINNITYSEESGLRIRARTADHIEPSQKEPVVCPNSANKKMREAAENFVAAKLYNMNIKAILEAEIDSALTMMKEAVRCAASNAILRTVEQGPTKISEEISDDFKEPFIPSAASSAVNVKVKEAKKTHAGELLHTIIHIEIEQSSDGCMFEKTTFS